MLLYLWAAQQKGILPQTELNVLLQSTFEYHPVLAANTFEYLAIEFPFKGNHPWDGWLAGPLSLTREAISPIKSFWDPLEDLFPIFFKLTLFLVCEADILRWGNSWSEGEELVAWGEKEYFPKLKLIENCSKEIRLLCCLEEESGPKDVFKGSAKCFYGRGLNGQIYWVRAATKLLWEK